MNINKSMCEVAALVIACMCAAGCGDHDTAASEPPYQVLEASDKQQVDVDGMLHRDGHMTTVLVDGNPRVLRYREVQTSASGRSETTINDTTDGSWSQYTVDDDGAMASIVSAGVDDATIPIAPDTWRAGGPAPGRDSPGMRACRPCCHRRFGVPAP